MSAVFGDQGPIDVAATSGEGVVPPDSSIAPEQSSAGVAGETGAPEAAPQIDQEVDPAKLDLTQPEGLRQFRSSYDKVKFERDEEKRLREAAHQELETIRANQGKGIFLDTNLPLEDFSPREALDRMLEEEPEYYEAVANDFMSTHFWPELSTQIQSIEGRPLNPAVPADAEKLETLGVVWDSLARRMSKGQLNGDTLYNVLEVLESSPDLQQVVLARMNGGQAPVPMSQPGAQPQQQQWGPQGVESAAAIATRYGLDPTDEAHAQLISQMQSDQARQQFNETQRQRELQQRDLQIRTMQQQLDALKNDQEGLRNTSSEDAQRRASARLTELLSTSLEADIQNGYSNAVPKDRPGLLGDLRTIAKATLDANPDYKTATAKAEKWFRQAAAARDARDRDRWDKAGLDALAVVSNYRAAAIKEAADRLLGPVRRNTARQEQRTRDLQNGRREIPGGQATPPISPRQPAPVGDMQATRDAVRARMREAIGRGVPGLPRV
jgi:hypothetical protein